jgi:L-2-hydroxyglutarate oxidase LhgO
MSKLDFDVLVIGAGVIGLAIARQLATAGQAVLLVEREDRYGTGASSRNTGCIHAGAYYHAGSLKAQLCLRGRRMLYEHCARFNVPHRKTGKIFLATAAEYVAGLEKIKRLAVGNGIGNLVEIDGADIAALEPQLTGEAALLCPESGVVDTHDLMLSLLGLAENNGLTFVTQAAVTGGHAVSGGWKIIVSGVENTAISTRLVINAAGIWAPELSRLIFPEGNIPKPKPVKGSYLRLSGPSLVSRIIYPDLVPGEITERVDATPGIDGQLRFGPTVDETLSCDDYRIADGLPERLGPLIQRYLPDCDLTRLVADFAGVRPKIATKPGEISDFVFEWADEPGWLDLWGIESPGLTSALAIAEHVEDLAKEAGLV